MDVISINRAQEAAAYFLQNEKWASFSDNTTRFSDSSLIGFWLQNQRQAYKKDKEKSLLFPIQQ